MPSTRLHTGTNQPKGVFSATVHEQNAWYAQMSPVQLKPSISNLTFQALGGHPPVDGVYHADSDTSSTLYKQALHNIDMNSLRTTQ